MKSTEVYAALREHLAPEFQRAGFKRAKAMLSWARPQSDKYLVVWCQVSREGWDDYAGSKFTVDLQLSDEAIVGAPHVHRQRLPAMLDNKKREEIRALQNAVIASLKRPPASYPILHMTESVRTWYLNQFRTIDHPYGERQDIWFCYANKDHLSTWAQFIIDTLPKCLQQTESWAQLGPQ